jgi:hypothetical protein
MNVRLTRPQRRLMQKLADRVDRASQSDRRFFERFPHRKHRVRLAGRAEIEQEELLRGAALWAPPPCRIFAAVRNVAPGIRLKLMIRGVEGAETDPTEEMAAAIFNDWATPRTWAVEAQMRAAVVRRDQ